jgi:hypothetical protein
MREERRHLRDGGDKDQVEEALERGHPLFGFGLRTAHAWVGR